MAIKDDMEDVQEAVINELITENGITNTLADGQVTESKILNGAVTTAKIDDGAIIPSKLSSAISFAPAANSLNSGQLADNAVTRPKIADNAVSTAKLYDDAVTTVKIADDAVTTAKIADDAVNPAKLDRAYLETTGGSVNGSLALDAYLTLKTTNDQANSWVIYTGTSDKLEFNYNGAGNAEAYIDNSGKVGIGVAPNRKLHVGGTGSGQGELHLTNDTTGHAQTDGSTVTTSGSDLLILQRENADIRISTNGSERMRIQADGTIILSSIPTSAPSTSGAIYSDGGNLKIVT